MGGNYTSSCPPYFFVYFLAEKQVVGVSEGGRNKYLILSDY